MSCCKETRSGPDCYVFDPTDLNRQGRKHMVIPTCMLARETAPGEDRTLLDILENSVARFLQRPYLGWRSNRNSDYDVWLTYERALRRITNIGCGLRWLDLQPSNATFIGVFSKNRVEVVLTQFACYQHSMVMVPLYDKLDAHGLKEIVNQTQMQAIICDDEDKVIDLMKWGTNLPSIRHLILFDVDSLSAATFSAVSSLEWNIVSFNTMENEGENNPVRRVVSNPGDLCLVCYTSGTTGKPKGAMIQHKGLSEVVRCTQKRFERFYKVNFMARGADAFISHLSLANVQEQIMMMLVTAEGGKIGFYSGEELSLIADVTYLKPTYLTLSADVMTHIYEEFKKEHSNWFLNKALTNKENYIYRGIITKSTIWDRLVFKKLQNMLGGCVKVCITETEHVPPPVLKFFRAALGAVVLHGYGQAESLGCVTSTVPGDVSSVLLEEVGPPVDCNMIKLIDVPEKNFFAVENVGEVCCKGVNVFSGYLRNEEKTREVIDNDGWLHTGDIGRWTERGTLVIIDRKRNIFSLCPNKYIALGKIENVYLRCPLVSECLIHYDTRHSILVGIVFFSKTALLEVVNIRPEDRHRSMEELADHPEVKKIVLKNMKTCGYEHGLESFQQVEDIYLTAQSFRENRNLITQKLKLKRPQCLQKYQADIERMIRQIR